jgi:hypothetical protein
LTDCVLCSLSPHLKRVEIEIHTDISIMVMKDQPGHREAESPLESSEQKEWSREWREERD